MSAHYQHFKRKSEITWQNSKKKWRERFEMKEKCHLLSSIIIATDSSSLLTAQARHWPPSARSGLLLSARTNLRTTGPMTDGGKVMRLLACHLCGGTGWQQASRMERDSSLVCHISPPNLIPATVWLNNNLLPKWKANKGDLMCHEKQKDVFNTRGACDTNGFSSMKWALLRFRLGYLLPNNSKEIEYFQDQ